MTQTTKCPSVSSPWQAHPATDNCISWFWAVRQQKRSEDKNYIKKLNTMVRRPNVSRVICSDGILAANTLTATTQVHSFAIHSASNPTSNMWQYCMTINTSNKTTNWQLDQVQFHLSQVIWTGFPPDNCTSCKAIRNTFRAVSFEWTLSNENCHCHPKFLWNCFPLANKWRPTVPGLFRSLPSLSLIW